MENLEKFVEILEHKMHRLLKRLESLNDKNKALEATLETSQKALQEQQKAVAHWEEKYETLRLANTILGSDDNKRETKLKINTLIREIDDCIMQLSS